MSFIPLAVPITTRDSTLTSDSRLLNCFWEQDVQGRKIVVKRPGLVTSSNITAGVAQGVFSLGAISYGITNDVVQVIAGSGTNYALSGVTVPGQRYYCISSIYTQTGLPISILQSISGMWYYVTGGAGNFNKVTDADFPTAMVPGVCYLDGTYYVMTTAGSIQGSGIETPSSWDALNFINTDRGLGQPVALVRHLNYVVAMCDHGVQFFYDAANPSPGSPLADSKNTLMTTGCAHSDSIQTINDLTIFLSKNVQRGSSVSALSGLVVTQLSTPFVDKVLNSSALTTVYSSAFKVSGHSFYLLTLVDINITLALDLITGDWAQWSSSPDGVTDNYFQAVLSQAPATPTTASVMLNRTTGAVYQLFPTIYRDSGLAIRASGRTHILEHSTLDRKFLPSINIVGDTETSTLQLRYTDDDYTTYSAFRSIDMSTVRKMLRRLGSFRRRAFDWLLLDNTPMRLEALEIPDEAAPIVQTP